MYGEEEERLQSFISKAIKQFKKYNVQKVMVTKIIMERHRLITKEKMENFFKGKEHQKLSINDDLETLFENIQLGEEPDDDVYFYFLPKLTEHELELVESKDVDFMKTFNYPNADVDKAEMAASESDSKYVEGWGYRRTLTIENPSYSIEEQINEQGDDETPPFKVPPLNQ